ncbi:MAG: endonuclease/exonuclease/phosphatase family protein, partial [Gemmatimonadetes bacterium]|nr:endonuclease/exonuclease/phosphatase family protein [Gemmatimonadota bacterium]
DPKASGYIYDDTLTYGGLPKNALFVIAGDQNSDPNDGDSIPGAVNQLLDHPRVFEKTKLVP